MAVVTDFAIGSPPTTSTLLGGGIGGIQIAGQFAGTPPTVTVTAPTGTVTTGGPTLTVTWTFSHPSEIQQDWRVFITNDADTTTYYDSGYVLGTDLTTNLNLVALGVPTDSTDISVKVWCRAENVPLDGKSALQAFNIEWGVVTTTIDSPLDGALYEGQSPLDPNQLKVEWTFGSTRSKTQQAYRCQLHSTSTGAILEDTNWVGSTTAADYTYGYLLNNASQYDVTVLLRNSEGVESS